MTETRSREDWIDWVRGLAASAVCIFHFNEVRPETGLYGILASFGWLGVSVFFVVSGYCIRGSSAHTLSWRSFLIARLFRVYPAYVISLVLVFAVVAWRLGTFGTNDIVEVPKTPFAIGATLLMLTYPATDVPVTNWVYWTLTYEVAFYALMATALASGQRCGVWLLLLVLLTSCVTTLNELPGLYFLKHWGLFALGIALNDLKNRRISGVFLGVFAVLSISANERVASQVTAGLVACLSLVAHMTSKRHRSLRISPFKFLGDVSYSLYLLHVPVGIYTFGRLVDLGKEVPIQQAVFEDIGLFAIVVAASTLMFNFIEKPSMLLGRRLGRRFCPKPVPVGDWS